MKAEISEIDAVIEALTKAKRHVSQIEQRQAMRTRKQDRYEKRRKLLQDLLKAGKVDEAAEQFEQDTGSEYAPLKKLAKLKHKGKNNSPRFTVKHKMMKKVVAKGGPIHPNLK
jgi:SOS response regulatory protein OraA/RecX